MLDRLASIFFGDIPVDQRRFVTRLLFRGIFLVPIAWACGWLAAAGLPLQGFANASDVEQVKGELTQKMEEVKRKVDAIEASWGYAHSLFIASNCADDDDEINGWPYPFLRTFTESAATSTSCSIYSAYIQLAIAGMGQLAWATTAAEEYVSAHIAVRPSV